MLNFEKYKKIKPQENIPVKKGKRGLIIGASGDIGFAVLTLLRESDVKIGAHYFTNKKRLEALRSKSAKEESKLKLFQGNITEKKEAHGVVDSFVQWAGGIDFLVQLCGDIRRIVDWEELTEEDWIYDLRANLIGPFFLAQKAFQYMKKTGGKIVLTSTASAAHGGGKKTMAYGAAKASVECLTKGLAREGAKYNILVNAISPGFIDTKMQVEKMKKSEQERRKRAELVRLKRAGNVWEVAGVIGFLLSEYGNFITGEVISISGGDWL
ncbi:MAG: SDR family oxidoreductase [Deltaproteobacteria bacterium]|nr:SDR family oxidoreductase [Deltaproteobacteria bacterium]